jgi:hypothetical protein
VRLPSWTDVAEQTRELYASVAARERGMIRTEPA